MKIILISFVILSGAFNYAFAGIGVEPALVEISAPTDETVSGELLVKNRNNQDLEVKAEAEYFFKSLKLDNKDLALNSWLTIEPEEFDLKSGEVKKVNYFINLPEGFKGETLAQIYFSPVDKPGEDERDKVIVKARFGVGLYVAAKDTEVLKAGINKIDVSIKNNQIKYAVEVENLGNVHLRPKGQIIIEDLKGNEIQRLETQYGWPVFPDSKYTYNTKWQNLNLAAGEYKAGAVMEYVNPYNQKNNKKLMSQILFTISKDGRVAIAKTKGDRNVL